MKLAHWSRTLLAVFIAVLAVVSVAHRIRQDIRSDRVNLVLDRSGAKWIQYPHVYNILTIEPCIAQSRFRTRFTLPVDCPRADLEISALSECAIWLDGSLIYANDGHPHSWKAPISLSLPSMPQGEHEISIVCSSLNSIPAIQVLSRVLPISTPQGWMASIDSMNWVPAIPVDDFKVAPISLAFPTVGAVVIEHLPFWIGFLTLIILCGALYRMRSASLSRLLSPLLQPPNLRWVALATWGILSINNAIKLGPLTGFDITAHIDYVSFIVDHKKLPLATDGWQMFQTPLNYIISAPFFLIIKNIWNEQIAAQSLRAVPIICGLLQIEVVYRMARTVFPDKLELQNMTVLFGTFLPMHTWICQTFGNEPLAGLLISLVLYRCMVLLQKGPRPLSTMHWLQLGAIWGLAILSKVTAVLLLPTILLSIFVHSRDSGFSTRHFSWRCLLVAASTLGLCAFHFIRNYLVLGQPLITYSHNYHWWQFPSIRTPSQLTSFGEALIRPIYAGTHGFWDSLYSTFWLDGFLSGVVSFSHRPPWNYFLLIPGAWLALPPMALLLRGGLRAVTEATSSALTRHIRLSIACILVFLIAMMDLYVKLPVYSVGKATYALGLVPLFSILVAAGAESLLENRTTRPLTIGLFSCWLLVSYAAYFVW